MKSLFLISLLLAPSVVLAGPALEIPGSRFNFGRTPQNSTLVHFFWFKSTGDDTLKIEKIKTGCSCALMPLERDWLAPGDSMKVGLFWDIKRKVGHDGKYPYIFTNAREDPYRLYLDCLAIADPAASRVFTINPFKFELSKVGDHSIDSLEFKITSLFDNDLTLQMITPQPDGLELYYPSILPANATVTGYVRLLPEYRDKELKWSVTFQTNDPENMRTTIPIRRTFY